MEFDIYVLTIVLVVGFLIGCVFGLMVRCPKKVKSHG